MKRTRTNPIPSKSCEEAWEFLKDEILNIDYVQLSEVFKIVIRDQLFFFDTSDPNVIDVIKRLTSLASYEDWLTFLEFQDELRSIREQNPIFGKYDRFLQKLSTILTDISMTPYGSPCLLMRDIEQLENVEFVHSFPPARKDEIESKGLYGRGTPSKLTLTREVVDFYIQGDGYIFAYKASQFDNGTVVVRKPTYIRGIAKAALSFYFWPDNEYQMIVPVKCIEEYTICETQTSEEDDDEYPTLDYLPHPSNLEIGASVPCYLCDTSITITPETFKTYPRMASVETFDLVCESCLQEYFDD